MDKITGIVKWFKNEKGFGFITTNNGGEDVFVHFKSINIDGYKTLSQGDKVSFSVSKSPKGLEAKDVSLVRD